jgi:AcrR family transcriptional regulator
MSTKKKTASETKRAYGVRRQEILDAALLLFNRSGIGPVSTNHIGEAVGISPGNLYYHFRNKEEIVLALLDGLRSDVSAHLNALPAADIARDIGAHFGAGTDIIWRYRFLFEDRAAVRRLGPDFEVIAREHQQLFVDGVSSLLSALQAAGWIDPDLQAQGRRKLASVLWILSLGTIDFARGSSSKRGLTRADVSAAHAVLIFALEKYLTQRGRAAIAKALATRSLPD